MKRCLCIFVLLLFCLSVPAYAISVDGIINHFAEYKGVGVVLNGKNQESNCGLQYAYLNYAVDCSNYTLNLALLMEFDDIVPDGGKCAVELSVNDRLCGTFYADGTMSEFDPYYFNPSFAFDFHDGEPSEIHCELQIGIKYGFETDTTVGIRIFDCSGIPSNYYEATVYVVPTPPTTAPEAQTAKETKTAKETTVKKETQTQTTQAKQAEPQATTAPVPTATTAVQRVVAKPGLALAVSTHTSPSSAETSTARTTKADKSEKKKVTSTTAQSTEPVTTPVTEQASQSQTQAEEVEDTTLLSIPFEPEPNATLYATTLPIRYVILGVGAGLISSGMVVLGLIYYFKHKTPKTEQTDEPEDFS